ncbi:MAG: sigma 54-interacting transcriptional regulator [Acidobacteria bacterium]|nr:sigma 54-interacting transcriptional regulator [Acidobacteriota bacterium]
MPQLSAISGPLKGQLFPLPDTEVTLGRKSENTLPIPDLSVSRFHCRIEARADGHYLIDLTSSNGTFVNGVPHKTHRLAHGDKITLAETAFIYIDAPPGEPAGDEAAVVMDQSPTLLEPVSEVRQGRLARQYAALVGICAALPSAGPLEELEQKLLAALLATFPADRAAIVFVEDGEPGRVAGLHRDPKRKSPISVSRTVLDAVLGSRNGVLWQVPNIASSAGAQAVMAAPLAVDNRTLGVLYLDSGTRASAFDEGHLELLAAISGVAGLPLAQALALDRLQQERRRLEDALSGDSEWIGDSRAFHDALKLVAKVARTESTVLILGESGTGKEMAARAVHRRSSRANGPFLALNCAALTESLLESELFGHEKGAFTGAIALKRGKIELANGGTLFLDEIGELAPALQAKLLRVLQEREFERVGGTARIRVDVRIVTATNRDLKAEVAANRFRQDLYYRLNVFAVHMPPLRERREDIALLANYFLHLFASRSPGKVKGVSTAARSILEKYHWPGNIRELKNVMEYATILGESDLIQPEDLPADIVDSAPPEVAVPAFQANLRDAKVRSIQAALQETEGNITQAAGILGVHPNSLHRMMRRLGLRESNPNA